MLTVNAMRYPTLMLLAVTLGACATTGSGPTDDMSLRVTPERAAPGDTVTLVLRNDSEDTLGYNLCTSDLFRRTDADTWDAVPSDRACTMELRSLSPRQRATFRLELAADVAPGTYRFETRVEVIQRDVRETVVTEPFEIES